MQVSGTFIPNVHPGRVGEIYHWWEGFTHLTGAFRFFIPPDNWDGSFARGVVHLRFRDGSEQSVPLADALEIDSLRDQSILDWLRRQNTPMAVPSETVPPALLNLATYTATRFPDARSVSVEIRRFRAPPVGVDGPIEDRSISTAAVTQ